MSDAGSSYRTSRLENALRRATTSPVPRVWLAALVVGVVAGYAAVAFRLAIGLVQVLWIGSAEENTFRLVTTLPWWLILSGPVGAGALVGLWLTWIQPGNRPEGVADVIEARAIRAGQLPLRRGLGSALVAAVSLGGGASAGREGPAVHLGATLGSYLALRLGFDTTHTRTLLAAGAASAVAASFNAPIAGVLFALEVVLGHFAVRASGPIVVASVTGALIARLHIGESPTFIIPDYVIASLWDFPFFALLGVASAAVAILFMTVTIRADDLARRIDIPLWSRPVIGGLMVGLIGLAFPQVLGVGYAATDAALQGLFPLGLLLALILAKTLATAVTLASRFGGGVFSPSLYLGAMTGGAFGLVAAEVAPAADLSTHAVYAIVGMGAVAGAVLGAPLSTLLIAFELTGGYEMTVALMVAISIATALTHGMIGRSFFQWQLETRNLWLYGGPRWQILHKLSVRSFMARIVEDDSTPHQTLDDGDDHLVSTDTLEHALTCFETTGEPVLPVVQSAGDRNIIGIASHTAALKAYNDALVEASREEHA